MMRQLFGLDVMRVTALLSVLLYHTGQLALTPPWPGVLQLLGSEGIQLFFVLSGFLFAALLLLLLPWTMITVYSGLLYLSGPAVGVLLAWTQRHRPSAWRALVGTSATGFGSQILLLGVGLSLLGTEHGAWLVLPLQLLQSACCLARLLGLATPTAPLVANPVRWLSQLTYAIYPTHLPILMAGAVLVGPRPGLYLPVILLLALPVILLPSAALHYFIEQPIILLGRRPAEAVVSRPAPGGVAGAGLYPAP